MEQQIVKLERMSLAAKYVHTWGWLFAAFFRCFICSTPTFIKKCPKSRQRVRDTHSSSESNKNTHNHNLYAENLGQIYTVYMIVDLVSINSGSWLCRLCSDGVYYASSSFDLSFSSSKWFSWLQSKQCLIFPKFVAWIN